MALSNFVDGRIFGERAGTSPRVLALHGWGRDHRDWSGPLKGVDGIWLDLPGFGASPPPPDPWGSSDYANAVAPVLDEFTAPAVIVGHSFGGRVALQLAALAPERVGALVLSGVPLGSRRAAGRPKVGFRVIKGLRRTGLINEERMEAARQRYGSDDYRRAEGVMRAVLVKTVAENYTDLLERIACPVELLWGRADTAAPVDGARAAARMLRRAKLTELEGDHFACLSQPEELRAAVERALTAGGG
ncbi:MAG TPA: alpha/beta hydrolase [Acidimicrobiales bacterium]|nr:alpha/beta hydrolase [Acidimicrobiales bacterium]